MADKADQVAKLMADAKASAADVIREAERLDEFRGNIRRREPRSVPIPPPLPPEAPQLIGAAYNYEQMMRLAKMMGDRSPVAYHRACTEQLQIVIAEIKELLSHQDDVAWSIGMRLHALKRCRPNGVSWKNYLKELGMPWGARRADEYISVFLGETTALELKKKKAASMQKTRANRAPRGAQPIVDSKEKSGSPSVGGSLSPSSGPSGSACAINWENHREDASESDAVVRKRALQWQLHEAVRLADEFALRRPGTHPTEVTDAVLRKIAKVIAAWKRLQKEMKATHIGGRHARNPQAR
jgi:hypothetical protein